MSVALALALTLAASPSAGEVLARHECQRCHAVEGLAPLARQHDCAGCHIAISSSRDDTKQTEAGRARYPHWDRFVERTGKHFTHLPALGALWRFRPEWLRAWLRDPYDLRPNLPESMPPARLDDAELEALLADVARSAPPVPVAKPGAPTPARLREGERLFNERGCAACHRLGNRTFETSAEYRDRFLPESPELARAPDLRHARDRLRPEYVAAFIREPTSVLPHAAMPALGLSEAESVLLAEFVLDADLGAPAPAPPRRAPTYVKGAPVPSYEEVEAKVFKKVCWHCHSNAAFNGGDGGPGNTGGFGYRGVGLSFASYEEVMSGAIGPDGQRRSIFRPGATGEPVLLERLRKRYVENDRDLVLPGHDDLRDRRRAGRNDEPGMPLGLPALDEEQFSLVERWVRGGHPPPSGEDVDADEALRSPQGM